MFSIIYGDTFTLQRTVIEYDNGSLLDALKKEYPLTYSEFIVSHKSNDGVREIPSNMLPYIRPKKGEYIAFQVAKDSDFARIALTAALIAAGQGYLATLNLGAVGTAVGGFAVAVGSAFLSSALIPYRTEAEAETLSDANERSTSSISGSGNAINQYGAVPYLVGTHKFAPPKAIQPITEYVNKTDAYLTEVFCLGYGPLIIDPANIKINDTPITSYDDIEIQIKDNYTNSSPISLVSGVVTSETVSATFSGAGDTATRTTAINTERIDIEIGYSGLTDYNDQGNRVATSVTYVIEYKNVNSNVWKGFNGSSSENTCNAVANPVQLRIKDGLEGNNDRQSYRYAYVNESYFEFPDGVPSYIKAGQYFTVHDCQYNLGSFYAYYISENRVYTSGYTIISGNTNETVNTFGRSLTDESNCRTYGDTGAAATSVDTDATAVATYRSYSLTNLEKGQYDVRITRLTSQPADDSNIRNEFTWTQIKSTQLTDDDGSAITVMPEEYCYIGVRIKATDQLNGSISNLSVVASSVCREYDETDQDLTGPIATGNPAWEYLKILTGSAAKQSVFIDEVDIEAFQEWADLCDELVESSNGTLEPRFRINSVFDTDITEEEVLKTIASVGRASRRWVDFKESVIVDKAGIEPAIFLSPANIVSFKWEKSFARRADAYRMSFYNQDNDYEEDEIIVKIDDSVAYEDLDYIESLSATGITDSDQLYRYGKFAHAQLRLRPETYTCELGINHLVFLRGDVVGITHDRIQGVTCFGQVVGVNGNVVYVDNPFNISNDDLPLYATFSNPESYEQTVATYEITDITGNAITFASLPTFDLLDSYYSIGANVDSLTRLYIVKNITSANDLTATVQLVDYAQENIYEAADNIANYESGTVDLTISQVVGPVAPEILDIVTDESALKINRDGTLQARAFIELSANYVGTKRPQPAFVQVFYRVTGTNGQYKKQDFAIGEQLYVTDVSEGLSYDFKVRYISQYGAVSEFAFADDIEVVGKTTPPRSVSSLDYSDGVLTWTYPNPEIDLAGFKIRYATGSNQIWETATPIEDGIVTSYSYDVSAFVASVNKFFVKAIDTSGNVSESASTVIVDLGDYESENIILTINKFDDGWPDTITGGYVDGATGYLCNDGVGMYTSGSDLFYPLSGSDLFYDERKVAMTYEFTYDVAVEDEGASLFIEYLSTVQGARMEYKKPITDEIYGSGTDLFYPTNGSEFFYPQKNTNFVLFSGVVKSLEVGVYTFKITVPANTQEDACLQYVKINIDVPDIEQLVDNYALTGGSGRLPITAGFRAIKNIQLTLQDDAGTAVTAKIVDKDAVSGPLIETRDASGALTESVLDARIRGY